jgi:hypothetical protein
MIVSNTSKDTKNDNISSMFHILTLQISRCLIGLNNLCRINCEQPNYAQITMFA